MSVHTPRWSARQGKRRQPVRRSPLSKRHLPRRRKRALPADRLRGSEAALFLGGAGLGGARLRAAFCRRTRFCGTFPGGARSCRARRSGAIVSRRSIVRKVHRRRCGLLVDRLAFRTGRCRHREAAGHRQHRCEFRSLHLFYSQHYGLKGRLRRRPVTASETSDQMVARIARFPRAMHAKAIFDSIEGTAFALCRQNLALRRFAV